MPAKSSEWLVLVSNEGSVMIPSMLLLLSAHNLPPVGARAPLGSDFVLMKERN